MTPVPASLLVAVPTATFTAPSFDYAALTPMFLVFGAACLSVLVEAFAPRRQRLVAQIGLSLVALVAALAVVGWLAVQGTAVETAGSADGAGVLKGSVVIDGPTLFLQGTILVLSLLAVLTMSEGAR